MDARKSDILERVPSNLLSEATTLVDNYGAASYNLAWFNARAQKIADWAYVHGNLTTMVVEFGCLDPSFVDDFVHNGNYNQGVFNEERYQFINDLRTSFETHGIRWSYWSFNEWFTVFKPCIRVYGETAVPSWVDNNMMAALGLPNYTP